jgi:hypothetical protein
VKYIIAFASVDSKRVSDSWQVTPVDSGQEIAQCVRTCAEREENREGGYTPPLQWKESGSA